ncbi:MAG: serine hydrolase [Bacteroidetes bacterium]|nr:serine hydrolase [Bacteroidota bacterium]
MKKGLLLLFLCAYNLGFSQLEKVNTFQKKLIENEITGSNVALVWQNGNVIYHHIENSFHENGKPINNNSIFPIWSMSKPITIVTMMILKERKMIDFNDDVSKYLPEFKNLKCKKPDGSTYQCKNTLSLFHLLTHRSGYGYYGNPQYFTSTIKYDNLEDFSKDVANHPVEFEPGSDYLYGINMAILGRIIEVVTNKTFYEFLKEELFDPLHMEDTKFYLTSKDRLRFQPLFINNGSLKGYTNSLDELSYDINNKAYFGGEGLTSTLKDYKNFCQMLVQGGKYQGKQIITQKSIDEMTGSYSSIEDDPFDYGYSLFVLSDPELDGAQSSKGIFGWSGYHNTHFWIDQEKNLFGLFMTRAREFSFGIQKEFRRAVYTSLDD